MWPCRHQLGPNSGLGALLSQLVSFNCSSLLFLTRQFANLGKESCYVFIKSIWDCDISNSRETSSLLPRRYLPPVFVPKWGKRSVPLTWRAWWSLSAKYSGVFLITEAGSREGEMESASSHARWEPYPAALSRPYLGWAKPPGHLRGKGGGRSSLARAPYTAGTDRTLVGGVGGS